MQLDFYARVTHEVNRAYCQSCGDDSQPSWDDAPEWQKESALNGVRLHLLNPEMTPADSHAAWMAEKLANGWTYGPEKNPELKQHHCLVPYDELPHDQQVKDWLFRATVHAIQAATKAM